MIFENFIIINRVFFLFMIKLFLGDEFMTNETYTFKEILLGLKDEYLEITKQLNGLKQYLLLEENNIESINIFFTQYSINKGVQLVCLLEERKKLLEKVLDKFIALIGMPPEQKVDYIKEYNNNFTFLNHNLLISESGQSEFNQIIINTYNREFVKNIKPIYCVVEGDRVPFLSVLPHNIYLSVVNKITLNYNPNAGDFIRVVSLKGRLSKKKIEDVFNLDFPKSKFPEYYQYLIESSQAKDKEIDFIGKIDGTKNIELEIIEDTKKLILKRK